MPRTVTITQVVYTFAELSDKAKERARNDYREADAECFDAKGFEERTLTESALTVYRLDTADTRWRLSHSQGDGVAFYGAVDLDTLRTASPDVPDGGPLAKQRAEIVGLIDRLEALGHGVELSVDKTNSHYDHWNSMSADVGLSGPEETAEAVELSVSLARRFDEYLTAVSHAVEKLGYEELDYLYSEANVDEMLTDDAEFYESGKRFY